MTGADQNTQLRRMIIEFVVRILQKQVFSLHGSFFFLSQNQFLNSFFSFFFPKFSERTVYWRIKCLNMVRAKYHVSFMFCAIGIHEKNSDSIYFRTKYCKQAVGCLEVEIKKLEMSWDLLKASGFC